MSFEYLKIFPLALIFFSLLENLYFIIAKRFNVYDMPDSRSSHNHPVIVGAGIVFYIAVLIHYFFFDPFNHYMFTGATLIMVVSFLDDRMKVQHHLRIGIQAIAVLLLMEQFFLLDQWHILVLLIVGILIMGTLNAYNFMDGINGMTGLNSIITLISIMYVHTNMDKSDMQLALIVLAALSVLLFYNLRKNAFCFPGDVGSVSMAFILIYFMLAYATQHHRWDAFLLFAVYGVDTVTTISLRIFRGEDIFKAHRNHLYQLLVDKKQWSHIKVSLIYAGIQLLVNVIFILIEDFRFYSALCISIAVTAFLVSGALQWRKRILFAA